MTENGSPPAEVLTQLASPAKLKLDPDALTPRDLLRAQDMFDAADLGDVYEAMGNRTRRAAVIIWCLRTRTDPAFTWDQALDTPYASFDVGDEDAEPDPPTAPSGSPGPGGAVSAPSASKPKRPARRLAPN